MKKPIIGITGNERQDPQNPHLVLSYAFKQFVRGVRLAGGLPLILPIGDERDACSYLDMIDKLIITGGQHVSPCFYGEQQTIVSKDYHLERDRFELALIHGAVVQKKPIFTVCRGTQLFNVAMGGSLHQSIKNHWQDELEDQATHEIKFEEGSVLYELYGATAKVNSFHRQGIKTLASGLKALAYDIQSHVIEAIASTKDIPFLGVQWHPEFLLDNSEKDRALFDYVVNHL